MPRPPADTATIRKNGCLPVSESATESLEVLTAVVGRKVIQEIPVKKSKGVQHRPARAPGLGQSRGRPLGHQNEDAERHAHVIGGEPFKIVIADNAAKAMKAEAEGGQCELKAHSTAGLSCLTLSAPANADVRWVAVGTGLSARPPHRSGRAELPHPALAAGDDV
jgi:hypothetical protein